MTNTKLQNVDPPRWAPFPGVSLLYDDPGISETSGLQRLERLPTRRDPGDRRLYRRLRELASHLAATARGEGVDVALLPRSTYHVTLCDSVNDGDRTRHSHAVGQEVATFLDALPDGLLWSSRLSRLLAAEEVCWQVRRRPVTFEVERVEVRGHALVAGLIPADDGRSPAAMAEHERARAAYLERLGSELGLQARKGWRPHVTLGYVGDLDAARRLDALTPRWQGAVEARTADATVTFRSAAPYGFTDMVSFWRSGP